jgi:hypothetical protein
MRVWVGHGLFVVGSVLDLFALIRTSRLYLQLFRLRSSNTADRKAAAIERLKTIYKLSLDVMVAGVGFALLVAGLALTNSNLALWLALAGVVMFLAAALSAFTIRNLVRRAETST